MIVRDVGAMTLEEGFEGGVVIFDVGATMGEEHGVDTTLACWGVREIGSIFEEDGVEHDMVVVVVLVVASFLTHMLILQTVS